jgi:hypothetical protein
MPKDTALKVMLPKWNYALQNKAAPRQWLLASLALTCILVWYWLNASKQLNLPGLHNDEAQEGGLQAWQMLQGLPVSSFRDAGWGKNNYPLMVQDYIGALDVYWVLPFVATLGNTTNALRLPFVILGALSIGLSFGFLWQQTNLGSAVLGALLLANHPAFVFWSRQGILVALFTLPLTIMLVWSSFAWQQRPRSWLALLFGLSAGLGLYAKLLLVWILIGTLASAGVFVLGRWGWQRRFPQRAAWLAGFRSAVWALAGLAIGLSPLLYYNIRSQGTWLSLRSNLSTSFYGVDNSNFWQNLGVRWQQAQQVLRAKDFLWYLGGSSDSWLWGWSLLLVVLGMAILLYQRSAAVKWGAQLLLLLGIGFCQSAFTVSDLFQHHLILFLPIWIFCLAWLVGAVWQALHNHTAWLKWAVRASILVFIAGLATQDTQATQQYHRLLTQSGGLSGYSNAIDSLAMQLMQRQPKGPVLALDWGIAPQIRYLSGEKIQPQEVFGYQWQVSPTFGQSLAPFFANPDTLYLLHVPQETVFPDRAAALQAAAEASGLALTTVATATRADGAPVFWIWQVLPAP